jgi:diacylglycerol kinase (ATP)
MRLKMIVNPNAGRKRGARAAVEAAALLREAGIEVDSVETTHPGHAITLAENLDPTGYNGVVAVGGDGTLFEVLNGLARSAAGITCAIGQIPVGSGNSFIKDLNLDSVDAAAAAIARGKTRKVDLGWFRCAQGEFRFVNLLGAGFVADVAESAVRHKRWGDFSYVIGVFQELAGLEPVAMTIDIDGAIIKRDAIFVEICNSRFTGGDMMMAPDALIDDGLLDVIVAGNVTRGKALRLLPGLFKGKHVENPAVEVFRGTHIRVETDRPCGLNADGEVFGSTPIEVEILPGAVEFFA